MASVGTNTFMVTAPDGSKVTVDVSSSTTYRDAAKTSATIADVTVGAHVAVFGTDADNTVTATQVGIGGPHGPDGNHGPGGAGRWAPPSSSGTATSGDSTSSYSSSSGSTLT